MIGERDKYSAGVEKLEDCAVFVEKTKQELKILEPQLHQKTINVQEAIKMVEGETEEAEKQQVEVA